MGDPGSSHEFLHPTLCPKLSPSPILLSPFNLRSVHKGLVPGLRADRKLGPVGATRNSKIPDTVLLAAWRTDTTIP